MKLSLREIIIVSLTAVLSFPVIYLLIMLATGAARIELSKPKLDPSKDREVKMMRLSAKKDSLAASQSQTFLAVEQEKAELQKQKQDLFEQQNRVKMVQDELEKTRTELAAERVKLEKLVLQSDELDKKRIKQLAKVYGAMRPDEAARILETLDDDLCMNILSAMGDDRQKAKILAVLSPEKASRISKRIGTPLKNKD
jgi:flagellar motility protein MotE (MotC chaperone)